MEKIRDNHTDALAEIEEIKALVIKQQEKVVKAKDKEAFELIREIKLGVQSVRE